MKNSWWLKLFNPVDISSLIYFRIAFGLTMMWEVVKYFEKGWINAYWIAPEFYFSYPLFEWLKPWPGNGMYIHLAVLGVLAFFITIGFFYRFSTVFFFLGFSYIFLLDETHYLNHFYLVVLLSFLLIFLPLNRKWSLDALIWPKLESDTAPAWVLWLLRFQIGVPYFFGGVAKLNMDWFQGEPMRMRLARRMDFPLIGQFFDKEWMVYFYTYGGLLIDLLAIPLLLWRRTRLLTFFAFILFHFNNAYMFSIGIFPWLMIAATTLYFDPAWPKLLWKNMASKARHLKILSVFSAITLGIVSIFCELDTEKAVVGGELVERLKIDIQVVPILVAASAGMLLIWALAGRLDSKIKINQKVKKGNLPVWRMRIVVTGLTLWCLIQTLLPLRHYLYPSNVHWSEEGHRFAWHMMLRDKQGDVRFLVTENIGNTQQYLQLTSKDLIKSKLLTLRQLDKMSTRPYMIHQFSHYLAQRFERESLPNVYIYNVQALSEVSLNGRDTQAIIDPSLDLAAQPIPFGYAVGVMPLTKPLKPSEGSLADTSVEKN